MRVAVAQVGLKSEYLTQLRHEIDVRRQCFGFGEMMSGLGERQNGEWKKYLRQLDRSYARRFYNERGRRKRLGEKQSVCGAHRQTRQSRRAIRHGKTRA